MRAQVVTASFQSASLLATVQEVTPFLRLPRNNLLIQNKMYVGLDGNSSFSSLRELGILNLGTFCLLFSLDHLARWKAYAYGQAFHGVRMTCLPYPR